MRPAHRLLLTTLAATVTVAVVAISFAFLAAQRSLSHAASTATTRHHLAFTLRTLDLAATQNPGFEPVSAPAAYTSGAYFAGDLYLAGPGGLTVFAPDGTPRQTFRTGVELPVQPIVAVTQARLRGASEAQLLLATSGAGLLLLTPNPHGTPHLRQLLPEAPEARDLTALLPMPSGDLLLGTRHAGLLLFDGKSLTPTAVPAREITALAAVDTASYLVGTRTSGLFYVHAGTIQHADGLPDNQVESLAVADGKAYAGTPLGTAEFDLSAEALKPSRIVAPGLFAHALTVAEGQLLIGTLDQGAQFFPLDARPRLRAAAYQPTSAQRFDQFLPGSPYALADGNLVARSGTNWQPALTTPSEKLADRNISALAFAPDGALYVGFFDHGLDIIPASNGPLLHYENDSLFCINRLALDPVRQTIAAATANGLVLFDRQGTPRQTLTRRDGLISDHITDIAFTRTGATIATPAGLTFLSPQGTESLYAFQGLVNNHVYTVAASGDQLLAGTLGGISVLNGRQVARNLTVANSGLKHNWITALVPNPAGGWLVGTYGGGLMTLSADGSRFTPIELPAGTPRDLVINPNALLVAGRNLYAGTLDHGFLAYDAASQRWSMITRGLPSLNVTAFAERGGELYVGTENGLVRIAETRLGGAQ